MPKDAYDLRFWRQEVPKRLQQFHQEVLTIMIKYKR